MWGLSNLDLLLVVVGFNPQFAEICADAISRNEPFGLPHLEHPTWGALVSTKFSGVVDVDTGVSDRC